MSYNSINACASDVTFQNRVIACVATQDRDRPADVMWEVIWPVSCASDVEAAYASALAADNPNPGGDETVVTDQMILSHVQANLPPAA